MDSREKVINDVIESVKSNTDSKFKLLRGNLDIFKIEEVHGYEHTGELDLSIYTILIWNKYYILFWYLSIRNLLKNTDILKVKKIIVMTTDETHDSVIEISKLFNIPTLFDIRRHDKFSDIIDGNNNYVYNPSKASFPLKENLTDITFILQDCDFYAHNCHDLYSQFSTYLHNDNNNDKILMFDDEFFPKEGIIKDFGRKLIGINTVTYTDKLKNIDDVKNFIVNIGVDIEHIEKIHNNKWYNASLVGFRKNSPVIDKKILYDFLDIASMCDESAWLLGAAKHDITVDYINVIFNKPFSFCIHKVKDEQSFMFSVFGGDEQYSLEYDKYYIKYILE